MTASKVRTRLVEGEEEEEEEEEEKKLDHLINILGQVLVIINRMKENNRRRLFQDRAYPESPPPFSHFPAQRAPQQLSYLCNFVFWLCLVLNGIPSIVPPDWLHICVSLWGLYPIGRGGSGPVRARQRQIEADGLVTWKGRARLESKVEYSDIIGLSTFASV